jgi:hypothetical protein
MARKRERYLLEWEPKIASTGHSVATMTYTLRSFLGAEGDGLVKINTEEIPFILLHIWPRSNCSTKMAHLKVGVLERIGMKVLYSCSRNRRPISLRCIQNILIKSSSIVRGRRTAARTSQRWCRPAAGRTREIIEEAGEMLIDIETSGNVVNDGGMRCFTRSRKTY